MALGFMGGVAEGSLRLPFSERGSRFSEVASPTWGRIVVFVAVVGTACNLKAKCPFGFC